MRTNAKNALMILGAVACATALAATPVANTKLDLSKVELDCVTVRAFDFVKTLPEWNARGEVVR